MVCETTTTTDGDGQAVRVTFCCRGVRAKRCVVCGGDGTRLCDAPRGRRTCDAPLCPDHTYSPSPGVDLCPRHAALLAPAP